MTALLRRRPSAVPAALAGVGLAAQLGLTAGLTGSVLLVASAVQAEDDPAPIEVTVAGTRGPPSTTVDASAASTVVEGPELDDPGVDAAALLERVPGVTVTRTGSSIDPATASVRGATAAQLPVYVAGIRINDDVAGTADLASVPVFLLDRVEVFRGNAPERADRLGIGGAVFFEPRRPRRSEFRTGVGIGSHGEQSGWLGAAAAGTRAGALIGLRYHGARNDYRFTDDRGTRLVPSDDVVVERVNADHTQYDLWALGRTTLAPRLRLSTVLGGLDREQGVTGLAIHAERARARFRRWLVGTTAYAPCPSLPSRACRLELTSSLLAARQSLSDPAQELSLGGTRLSFDAERFAESLRLTAPISDAARLTVSTAYEVERLAIDSDGAGGLRAQRTVLSATAAPGIDPTRELGLHGIARLSCHTTRGPDGGEACGVLEAVGRVGASLSLGEVTLLANAGRAVRVPTLAELYGVSASVRGTPDLAPEIAYTLDAGARGVLASDAWGHAWLDAFVFGRLSQNLVGFRRSSLGFLRPFNVGRARTLGAEIALGLALGAHVTSDLAVALLDPRDTSPDRGLENDLIPFQSRWVARHGVELSTRSAALPLELSAAAVGLRQSYRSARVADPAGLIVIDGEYTLDVYSRLSCFEDILGVRFTVTDVFGSERFDAVGFPLPGRSVHASVELAWLPPPAVDRAREASRSASSSRRSLRTFPGPLTAARSTSPASPPRRPSD
ncbi:MAG TPA: TonB-dependent receptor [Polyangiaceae bacterium]